MRADLEGIVGKRKSEPYLPDHPQWLKVRNHDYSQWAGRVELFERERGTIPTFTFRMSELWRAKRCRQPNFGNHVRMC